MQQHKDKEVSGINESEEDEEKRDDLYSVVRDLRENQDNPPIARCLYVALLNEGIVQSQKIEIESKIDEIIKGLSKSTKDDNNVDSNLTGFFLQKGMFCIHMLEGDSQVLNQYLSEIYKLSKREKSEFQLIRIITFNEENPSRNFDKHYFDDLPSSGSIQLEGEYQVAQYQDKAWQIYLNFCEAGKRHVNKKHKERNQKKLASEITLTHDDVSMLCMPHYMSIEQYAQLYLEDLEIKLDSEIEYPYKGSLTKYLEYSDLGTLEEVSLK